MTTGEIKTYISYLVDDLQMTYFTSAQLLRFINQSLREAQKLLCLAGQNYYVKEAYRQTVANQKDYILPCNTLYIHRIELRQGSGTNIDRQTLSSITLNQQDNYSTFAQPVGFFLERNYLILCPIPQDATKQIYMWYTPLVDEVSSDSDIPNLPLEYHEYLAQKAASLCFVKDDRSMDNMLPVLKETEERLKAAAIERVQSHGSKVVTQGGRYLGAF